MNDTKPCTVQLDPDVCKLELKTNNHSIYSTASSNIIVKVLNNNNEQCVKRLYNELKIGQLICHYGLRRSIDLVPYDNRKALLLEWVDGYPLSQIIEDKRFLVKEFILSARDIVSALLAMHTNCMVHTNLTSDHIIYNRETKTIKIIGIGSAVKFEGEKRSISQFDLLEKDLHYISPEMGSMVKRHFDLRTDLYSLGVIFYKMLTGKYPLVSEDKMKLILLHVSQEPLPVQYIDPNIPATVSQMISKLLSKNTDERYQTAKGLIYDLDMMISEYDSDTNLTDIVLAENDKALPQLLSRSKLYGREGDFDILSSVLKRVTHDSSEVVFVTGTSGTGMY